MYNKTTILDGMQFSFFRDKEISGVDAGTVTMTYQWSVSQPADLPTSTTYTGWTAATNAEKAAMRAALDHIETLIDVTFTEVTGDPDPDLNFGKVSLGGNVAGTGGYGASSNGLGLVTRYDGFTVFKDSIDVSQGQDALLLHEVGHALGLKHPFSAPVVPAGTDSTKYSLMSYTDNPDTGLEGDNMMLFDIFALQELWGANTTHATGDDTYDGPRGIDVDAIWDAGGHDTIDGSAYGAGSVIDLRPGYFSSLGAFENVVIAYNTSIEVAVGGDGRDTISGSNKQNTLLGGRDKDLLRGLKGSDTLDGGNGADRLQGGTGKDSLDGGAGADKLYGQGGADKLRGGGG
ncbi:MAG: M10 family metallopeptidase C-terminal domain-containing protein, partial [Pseudomonadota bacterium]